MRFGDLCTLGTLVAHVRAISIAGMPDQQNNIRVEHTSSPTSHSGASALCAPPNAHSELPFPASGVINDARWAATLGHGGRVSSVRWVRSSS
jgi:hypothetical protein